MTPAMRRWLFFALNRAIGSRVRAVYREFLRLERADEATYRRVAGERLDATLRHAVANVPFYRETVRASPPGLADFPVVTKQAIAERFDDLVADEFRGSYRAGPPRRYGWIKVKTGGSSGEPTTVIHDASFRDQGRASRLYSQSLCGFPFGTPYFRLWGSMAEISAMRDSPGQRIMHGLARERMLNAFLMDDTRMAAYLEAIRRSPAVHLMAYVDAAVMLAGFAKRKGIQVKRLASVMACAGTVTPGDRAVLREVFGGRVHNKYGSRDCTDMACECDRGGLHVYGHHTHIEIVDDRGNPVPPGETGRILVTLLGNPFFPLIRYEIGDTGAWQDGRCECGRPFPLLARLEGRWIEGLTSTRGGYVSPVSIRHIVGVVHNPGIIRRFQMVQESDGSYRLALELSPGTADDACRALVGPLEADLRGVLGSDAALAIVRVDAIPPSASGKFLYTINRMRQKT